MMSSWMREKLWMNSMASAPTSPTRFVGARRARRQQRQARSHELSPGRQVVIDEWTQVRRPVAQSPPRGRGHQRFGARQDLKRVHSFSCFDRELAKVTI